MRRSELDRVLQDIPEHLLEPAGISDDHAGISVQVHLELYLGSRNLWAAAFADVAYGRIEIEEFRLQDHFPADDSGHVQQVIDELGLELDVPFDHHEIFTHLGSQAGI